MTAVAPTIHVFERAGLGKAPFTYIGWEKRTYQACPGAPIQPGATCDYCGTAICFVFLIDSADHRRFKVGSDCVAKTGDRGLKKAVDQEVRERERQDRHQRDQARIENARQALTEPVRERLAAKPHPYGGQRALLRDQDAPGRGGVEPANGRERRQGTGRPVDRAGGP